MPENRVCFDVGPGEVIVVPADVMQAVEESDVEMITNFQEWKKDLVETAEKILFYERERYIDLPESLLSLLASLMVKHKYL